MPGSKKIRRGVLTPPLLWLMGAHFLQGVGWASTLLLPLYVDYLGGSRATIGWVMGLAAISGLIFRPLIGWGLDRWGRRKTVTAATVTLTLGMLLIGGVTELGPMLYASRLIVGVGVAALFTGYFTFASDLVVPERRTEGLAIFGVSGLAPLLVNPVSEAIGVDAPDLRWFFPLISILVLLSLVPLFRVRDEVSVRRPSSDGVRWSAHWRALLAPQLWPVWLVTIILGGLVVLFLSFATVAARSAGLERPTNLWLTYAGGAIIVRLVGARLPDVIGTHNLVVPALSAYIAAALLLADASSAEVVLLGGLLAGVAHGYAFPVVTSQVITRVPESLRGMGMSVFTGLWDVSRLVLAPILGAVADATDDSAMFATGAVGACVLLAVWVLAEHALGGDDRVTIRGPAGDAMTPNGD
jgi:predicted MFS family arabinose efflux permease